MTPTDRDAREASARDVLDNLRESRELVARQNYAVKETGSAHAAARGLLDAALSRLAKAEAAFDAMFPPAVGGTPAEEYERKARLAGYEPCPACGECTCIRSGTRYRCRACGATDETWRVRAEASAGADAEPTIGPELATSEVSDAGRDG